MALGLVGALAAEGYSAVRKIEVTRTRLVVLAWAAGSLVLLIVACQWLSGPSHGVPSPQRAAAIQLEILERLRKSAHSAASPTATGLRRPAR